MAGDQPTFSFECVAILVAALAEKGMTIGNAEYKLMAEIDGTRTASGYEHLFRKVKARGKELATQRATGNLTPAKEKKQPNKRVKSLGKSDKNKREHSEDDFNTPEPTSKKVKQEDTGEPQEELESMF